MTPLYHNLKILQQNDLIALELVKYGYKISDKLYPTRLHKLAESNGGLKQHRYPTRYKKTPNIQKHKTNEFNKSHLCKGLVAYNKLPNRLKQLDTLKRFTRKVKNHLLSSY